MTDREALNRAAAVIGGADGLLIATGAGMGVDSGLPDFRGVEGFWRAYPPFRRLGLQFEEIAQPRWFREDPWLAWGFYGHRHNLYQATRPHAGFEILRSWCERKSGGGFCFTSNVDGHWQAAGFAEETVCEVHGRLAWNQCLEECGQAPFAAGSAPIRIDEQTFRAEDPMPQCPRCHGLARPNVLMFCDGDWDSGLTATQWQRLQAWLAGVERLAILEIGAGTAVPTVRNFTERLLLSRTDASLVRINPREPRVPSGQIGLAGGGLDVLTRLAAVLDAIQ